MCIFFLLIIFLCDEKNVNLQQIMVRIVLKKNY